MVTPISIRRRFWPKFEQSIKLIFNPRRIGAAMDQAQALAKLGSWSINMLTGELLTSRELRRMFSLPHQDPVTRDSMHAKIHTIDKSLVQQYWQLALAGSDFIFDYRIRSGDTIIWVRERVVVECDANGIVQAASGTVQDISDLKAKELELLESREHLRLLADHNDQVREEERRRIARELHDEMGQLLTALRLDISLTSMAFGHLNKDLEKSLQSLKTSTDHAIRSTRNVAASLRPPALDVGLKEASEWLIDSIQQRSNITCHLLYKIDNTLLSDKICTAVYRLLQESLTNVVRHARASDIQVRLTQRETMLDLEVTDNGDGFEPSAPQSIRSFGLAGMHERVSMLGGTLKIQSRPGQGTKVLAVIPLRTQKEGMIFNASSIHSR
jgi:signal transduction histidine kinase